MERFLLHAINPWRINTRTMRVTKFLVQCWSKEMKKSCSKKKTSLGSNKRQTWTSSPISVVLTKPDGRETQTTLKTTEEAKKKRQCNYAALSYQAACSLRTWQTWSQIFLPPSRTRTHSTFQHHTQEHIKVFGWPTSRTSYRDRSLLYKIFKYSLTWKALDLNS